MKIIWLLVFMTLSFMTSLTAYADDAVRNLYAEAGTYMTGTQDTLDKSNSYGAFVLDNHKSPGSSGAVGYMFKASPNFEVGLGVRAGNSGYSTALSPAAVSDVNTHEANIATNQAAIAALDENSPTYESDKAPYEEAIAVEQQAINWIKGQFSSDESDIGADLRAMYYLGEGKQFGAGAEVFANGQGAVPAARLEYRVHQTANTAIGLHALIGEDWQGGGLQVRF